MDVNLFKAHSRDSFATNIYRPVIIKYYSKARLEQIRLLWHESLDSLQRVGGCWLAISNNSLKI